MMVVFPALLAVALALPSNKTVSTGMFPDRSGRPSGRNAFASLTWRENALEIRLSRLLNPGEQPKACGTQDRPETMFGGAGESLEAFLAPHPDDPGTFYQIAVNPSNVCYLAKGGDADWRPAKAIVTRPFFSDGAWGVEMTVPFGAFGEKPVGNGARWRANFCSGGANWCAISFYHNPFTYGDLVFGGTFPRVDAVLPKTTQKDGTLFELDRFYYSTGTTAASIRGRFAGLSADIRRLDGGVVAEVLEPGEYAIRVADGTREVESQFEVDAAGTNAPSPTVGVPYYPISGSVDIGSRMALRGVFSGWGYDRKIGAYVYDSSLPACGGLANLAKRPQVPVEFNRLVYEAQIDVVTRKGKDGPSVREPSSAAFYARMYRLLKAQYPERTFTLQLDHLKGIDLFAEGCDVLEAAFPGCSYSAEPLAGMKGAFDFIRYYVKEKPVVFWIGGALPDRGAHRTADEMNTAVRYSILRGAVGNMFHLGHGGIPPSRTRLWDFMRGIERHVNVWYPDWVDGRPANQAFELEEGVCAEMRLTKRGVILLVVNLSAEPRTFSFVDPKGARKTVRLPARGSFCRRF